MDSIPPTQLPDSATGANEETAELRAKVDALSVDTVHPVVVAGADYAQRAVDWIDGEAERWSSRIRERPLSSIGIAALLGYVLALSRRA